MPTVVIKQTNCPASCDEVNLTVNALTPIAYTGLTGCPYEIAIGLTDQNGTDRGSIVGGNLKIYSPPRKATLTTLTGLNKFGSLHRMTGLSGGYQSGITYYDVDDNVLGTDATARDLAFPNGIVLVWDFSDLDSVRGVELFPNTLVSGNRNTQDAQIAALNDSSYLGKTNWRRQSREFAIAITDTTQSHLTLAMNYPPFNWTEVTTLGAVMYLEEAFILPTTTNFTCNIGVGSIGTQVNSHTSARGGRVVEDWTFVELGLA